MANSLSDNFPEFWSKRLQRVSEKKDVFRKIATFEEAGTLEIGDRVNRPYGGTLVARDMGSQGSYYRQDVETTNQYLEIDQEKETTFYVKDVDALQSKYPVAKWFNKRAATALKNKIDGTVLGEWENAKNQIGNYEMGGGGTAGDGVGFTLTASNIAKVFSRANKKLDRENAPQGDRKAVISPDSKQILIDYLGGKESALGDATGKNGNIGRFGGFDLYLSNALGWSGRLEFGTNPTDGDSITINGVTFNFVATLGSAAGNVHICSSAAKTLDQLVSAINSPATDVSEATDAGFISFDKDSDDEKSLINITAVDGGTYLTIKAEGEGYVSVSESLTASADIWTTTKQIEHNLFMQGTPIELVIQKYPNMEMFHRDGYIGKDVSTWTLFGLKTFKEGKRNLVDVQIRSDAY